MVKKVKLLLIVLMIMFVMVGSKFTNAHAHPCDLVDPQIPPPVICIL